ncbi:hypothetical protein AMELA_G00168500 [Ameiurus melas]|uniref:Uncharacterized protein n=1 Tax=Ameiurus melas TaxID=219545 RepID=A0A7J6AEN2_AMEME|nr:hypothetical protein AMELA_G00168500 [Ameiurus melas]
MPVPAMKVDPKSLGTVQIMNIIVIRMMCNQRYGLSIILSALLLVFSLLEICVSIWTFVLTLKARGSTEATT